jgi:hypothetical protein
MQTSISARCSKEDAFHAAEVPRIHLEARSESHYTLLVHALISIRLSLSLCGQHWIPYRHLRYAIYDLAF